VAADALDEWLESGRFGQRPLPDGPAKDLRAPGRSVPLHATDTDPALNAERSERGGPPPEEWGRLIELPEEGVSRRRGHEKATVALRGPLTSVLFAFYRRPPPNAPELQVIGDLDVLRLRLDSAKFG
jgi:hypothetical protein